jgi:hypothetical protein
VGQFAVGSIGMGVERGDECEQRADLKWFGKSIIRKCQHSTCNSISYCGAWQPHPWESHRYCSGAGTSNIQILERDEIQGGSEE